MSKITPSDWKELLSFKSEEEIYELYTQLISLRIARQIDDILDQKGITRCELAKMINTSPSCITQIMKGNKIISLNLVAMTYPRFLKENLINYDLVTLIVLCFSSLSRQNIQPHKGKWHNIPDQFPIIADETHKNVIEIKQDGRFYGISLKSS